MIIREDKIEGFHRALGSSTRRFKLKIESYASPIITMNFAVVQFLSYILKSLFMC